MPKKAPAKKTPINITRITEQKLIDEKLRQSAARPSRLPRVVALAAILGFLVSGIVLAYYFFMKPIAPLVQTPEFILPQESETSNQQSEPAQTLPAIDPVRESVQVEILSTPVGFLNVRSGPGTSFTKIEEALPGELFDLASDDLERGWYEIRLTATSTGWVTKQYAKIK